MHSNYLNPAIRQLRDQQVRFAPREKRIEQAAQAERLLRELDPARTYPYEYICYRVTNYRPESYPDLKLSGHEARHDLGLFVEDVSDSIGATAEAAGELVLTVEELARQFNVSTKTISRWRRHGLISRRFVIGGRKRVGFLQSSVQRFVEQNRDRVARGAQFSQLTPEERSLIIERARRLARAGGGPADVTKRLARRTGRSAETIRYTLRQFDHDHPEAAVFPDSYGPLQLEAKRRIYQQYQRGEAVDAMAARFHRTRTSIYRIIAEMRAQRIMELPLDYIPNDSFARVRSHKREERVIGPLPDAEIPQKKSRLPSGLPPYLASLYEVPLLTRKQEAFLFRKMNYLKYKANRLRTKLDADRPKRGLMDQIERLYDEAVSTKNQIIRANLRLVVSIAKRHVGPAQNFFELVSDGNMSLMRAVEKFDYGRGNKFSTYASWAVMKNFARTIPDEHRHRDRFRTSHAELFTATEDDRPDPFEEESQQTQREAQVERILERLDEREQRIIVRRFGLRRGQEPLTLKQVGAELGVTKERIRQIEARALSKLRKAAEDERIEFPS
ncbi:MAG: sigma-70 family RNA polymerase sigma factor [Planctomycetaceae bacterium]|nr:sigma-70 family RNA polymerase sigma factor [Planctomycetaceae bacterium]